MPDALFDEYLSAWNAPDAARAAELLASTVTEDVRFVDPQADVTGREALLAHVRDFRARYPDARVERTSQVDRHHDRARYAWAVVTGAGRLEGLDAVRWDASGRFARIDGFFGPLQPRA